jgi:hypothetical protein
MSDETTEVSDVSTSRFTRRNALKAGVAAGVGVAAWSGATITSMGGTPAFATPGCTGIIHIDLSGGCRNTDQASTCNPGTFRFHTLNTPPSGFMLTNNPGEGTCCDVVQANMPVLSWTTKNLTCTTHVELWINGLSACANRSGTLIQNAVQTEVGGPTGGSVTIDMGCFTYINGNSAPSPSFWTIYANCASNGAPSGCL